MARARIAAAVFATIIVGVLLLEACGGEEENAANTSAASTMTPRGEPIVLVSKVVIAAAERADVIATGEVLAESTLAGSAFCVGGTILDFHGSPDPQVFLIARTISCPEGRVRIALRPEVPHGRTQTGSWTIVGGTGDFEGLRGSGKMEVLYGPAEASPARETLTGTVTR